MILNIVDSYCWEKHRKILTPNETQIPALRCFGNYTNNHTGQPLLTHMHKGCIEIVFLLKGYQIYEVGEKRFNLSGGNLFIAYPDEPHSSGTYPESICDMIWMQIDLSHQASFFGLDEEQADYLKKALYSLPRLFGGSEKLRTLLSSSFSALSEQNEFSKKLGQQLFVCALFYMKQLSLQKSDAQNTSIEQAVFYIHEHLYRPILLEEAAASCGLSLSRFKVRFKEKTGTTPRDYINRFKIEQAKKDLKAGKSVTNTALDLGFSTSNYFAVLFRKYTGQTPTEYRNSESPLL